MKNWLLISNFLVLLLIKVLPSSGQNLVNNGSFETLSICPDDLRQIKRAVGWFNPFGTPDLMATCATNPLVGVPENFPGYQLAFSGSNYASIAMGVFPNLIGNYEFISSELNQNITLGKRYCIQLQISLGDTSGWAMNKIGIALTEGLPQAQYLPHWLPVQFESPDTFLLDDNKDWMTVSGTFTATNTADYITIGQFNEISKLNIVQVNNNGSELMVYYIDDIQLYECPEEISIEIPNVFTPNNDGVNDALPIAIRNAPAASTQIFNRWGNIVFESTLLNPVWDGTFNGNPVAEGVYFVVVQATGSGGALKTENQTVHLFR